MEKNPGIRLVVIAILTLIFFIPLQPTVKWSLLDKKKRESAEMKFQAPDEYYKLPVEKQQEIDKLKKLKNDTVKLGLDLQGGMYIVLAADLTGLKTAEERRDAVNKALEVIRNRIDQFGVSEPSIIKQGEDKIVVELPGEKDPKRAEDLLNVRGKLEFQIVDADLSKPENFKDIKEGILNTNIKIPEDETNLPVWEKDKVSGKSEKKYHIIVKKEPALTGSYLKSANVDMSQFGESAVSFELKSEGADKFYEVTKNNVNKQLAIVLDGKVRSHPNIKEPLRDRGQITGNFTPQEAQDLALILRAGATPVELNVVEKRIVGASLGEDSINAGINSGLIASVFVILFMLIYYKFSGLVANLGLFLNIFFLISVLKLFNFTLSLPGIAGIVLTIAISVDANVLIFERIKEELHLGKSLRASIDAGFAKAFTTILDANVTTLITAAILAQFGTGPIKGFAFTLLIGVSINLFTAVYVCHNIFDYLIYKLKWQKVSI